MNDHHYRKTGRAKKKMWRSKQLLYIIERIDDKLDGLHSRMDDTSEVQTEIKSKIKEHSEDIKRIDQRPYTVLKFVGAFVGILGSLYAIFKALQQ